MQVFEGKDDCREVEASDVWGEPLSASQVCEEFTSGNVGQQHVDVEAVLEGGVEVDNERMSNTRHDVAFRIDVFDLSKSDNFRLAKDLESETIERSRLVRGTAESNEQHTPKRASTWMAIGVVRHGTRHGSCRRGCAKRCEGDVPRVPLTSKSMRRKLWGRHSLDSSEVRIGGWAGRDSGSGSESWMERWSTSESLE